MDLKKALSFVAFGFLLTLVNVNLNFEDRAVNIMPAFVGWFLLLLANYKLGDYISDRKYLKIFAPVMVVLSAAFYVLEFTQPGKPLTILQTVLPILSSVYVFILCGALEKVALDYKSTRGATLHVMKYMNLGIVLVMDVLALVIGMIKNTTLLVVVSMVILFFGIAALFIAIAMMVSLFRLRKDVMEKL